MWYSTCATHPAADPALSEPLLQETPSDPKWCFSTAPYRQVLYQELTLDAAISHDIESDDAVLHDSRVSFRGEDGAEYGERSVRCNTNTNTKFNHGSCTNACVQCNANLTLCTSGSAIGRSWAPGATSGGAPAT